MQSFPFEGLQPKRETQAEEFLKKHPSYNGKDVVIAILDTGVDPAAPGLSKCPDGKDKILDVVDCTGSGDVVLSEEVSPSSDLPGILLGLSGNKLKIGAHWQNPSGKFRLGLIKLYDFFATCLVKRIAEERKEKFLKEHSILLGKEQAKLDEWNKLNPIPKTPEKVIEKQELESRISALKLLQESYQSNGEVFNVVTFHDGKHFRAAFAHEPESAQDETIDLSQAVLYTDYKHEHQYGFFGKEDLLSFSVNFYSEGKVLSLVTNAGSHGTHVAAITSAYFPDAPEKNGIAPGARIISLKIGDTRLGSLETGIGLARAIKCIKEWNCHLVNMSYGEAIAYPEYGFFVKEMQELVWNQGVIFVSSAGNNGPCISTVGAPGGTSSCAIGVGAYVTQSMMKAEYALREKNPDMPYSWSSNGPTFDGDAGVTVFAPGAAITSVPLWTLSPNQRMNGTSMSSPNACGCIALVLSGLLQESIAFSFPRVKNALLASSKSLAEKITDSFLGAGLLQVDNLFENIKANAKVPFFDFFFQISVPELGDDARGIYVRRAGINNKLKKEYFNVDVNVKFPRELNNQIKIRYENHLSLCATQPWISIPENLHLNSNGNRFQICIDYEMIDQECTGNVHYGLIKAFDPSVSGNCIFSVPVTIVRPVQLSTSSKKFSKHLIINNGQM
jgi:tripeptidyl-peptidase-2